MIINEWKIIKSEGNAFSETENEKQSQQQITGKSKLAKKVNLLEDKIKNVYK